MRKLWLPLFLLLILLSSFLLESAFANPDVAVTTNSYGPETASQRRLIETSLGVLWKAWSDGTNMRFNVSADDGATWLNAGTVRAATLSRQFAIWYDSDYNVSLFWYIYTKNAVSSKWYTARCTLNSSQTGFTAGTEYSYGSSNAQIAYWYGTIICLLNGSLQAFVTTVAAGLSRMYLWRASSNTGSDFLQYTTQIAAYAADTTPWENSAVPLATTTRSYVIAHQDTSSRKLVGRRWNGTMFDAQICVSYFGGSNQTVGQNGISLSNDGDESYAVWESHKNIADGSAHEVIAHATVWSNNTLGPLAQISNDDQAVNEHGPTISVDSGNDVQAVVWGYSDDLYYRVYREAAWEDIETYNPGYAQVIEYTVNSPWHLPIENAVPVTYQQSLIPPYTLYFKMFDITPVTATTEYFFGSITALFTIGHERSFLLSRTGSVAAAFAITSSFNAAVLLNLFGSILVTVAVAFGKAVSFSVVGSVNPSFAIDFAKTIAFSLQGSVDVLVSISSIATLVSGTILYLFGSIALNILVAALASLPILEDVDWILFLLAGSPFLVAYYLGRRKKNADEEM